MLGNVVNQVFLIYLFAAAKTVAWKEDIDENKTINRPTINHGVQ